MSDNEPEEHVATVPVTSAQVSRTTLKRRSPCATSKLCFKRPFQTQRGEAYNTSQRERGNRDRAGSRDTHLPHNLPRPHPTRFGGLRAPQHLASRVSTCRAPASRAIASRASASRAGTSCAKTPHRSPGLQRPLGTFTDKPRDDSPRQGCSALFTFGDDLPSKPNQTGKKAAAAGGRTSGLEGGLQKGLSGKSLPGSETGVVVSGPPAVMSDIQPSAACISADTCYSMVPVYTLRDEEGSAQVGQPAHHTRCQPPLRASICSAVDEALDSANIPPGLLCRLSCHARLQKLSLHGNFPQKLSLHGNFPQKLSLHCNFPQKLSPHGNFLQMTSAT